MRPMTIITSIRKYRRIVLRAILLLLSDMVGVVILSEAKDLYSGL